MKRLYIILYVMVLLVLASSVSALNQPFQPAAANGTDTYVASGGDDDKNFGVKTSLGTGLAPPTDYKRTLMNWNFTCETIGSGNTITNVILELNLITYEGGGIVTIYPMNHSFIEGTTDGGDFPTSWNTCGEGGNLACDGWYDDTWNISTSNIIEGAGQGGNITLDPDWLTQECAKPNSERYGFIILGDESSSTGFDDYYSSDDLTAGRRPILHVNWTITATPPGAPATPIYSLPTPIDNAVNNTNVTINCTTTQSTTNLRFFLNISKDGGDEMTYVNNATEIDTGYYNFTTNFTDGVFDYDCYLQNISNGLFSNKVSRTITIDTTTPTVNLNPSNSFNISSVARISQYANYLFFNITAKDETNLFGFLINVTKDGKSYFNYTNISFSGGNATFNFTKNVSTSAWASGVYNITVMASDSHTIAAIKDYDISKFLGKITFDTIEGNEISISGSGAYSTTYAKTKDRYEFGFNYLLKNTERQFTLKSKRKIYYLPNSMYDGHFVVLGNNLDGNWIDFEEVGKDYSVERINDYEYKISFTGLPDDNEISFKSLGGINKVTKNYKWYRGNYTTYANTSTAYGKTETFLLNVTRNLTYANPNATFIFNEVLYTTTSTAYGDYVIFTKDITIPRPTGISEDISYFWNVSITQPINNNQYYFTVSDSINTSTSLLHNCSIYNVSTLNVSFIDFDTGNPLSMSYKYSMDYGGNNFSDSGTAANFTLCLFEDETTVTGDLFIEYANNSALYTYYIDDLTLTNTTQIITLRIASGTTDITGIVYDETNNLFEGVYIRYLKWDVDTNNYELMGIGKTNMEGETVMPLVQDTELYKFMLYYPYATLRQSTTPTYVTSTSILFQISTGEDVAIDFHRTMDIDTRLIFSNVTNRFTWTYSDTNSVITQACLDVFRTTVKGFNNTVSSECLSTVSGVITGDVTKENGTTYCANAEVTLSGEDWLIDSLCSTYPSDDPFSAMYMVLLIDFIMTIAFAFAFKYSAELGAIAVTLPTLFCSIMFGGLPVDVTVAIGMVIAGLILAVVLNKVID